MPGSAFSHGLKTYHLVLAVCVGSCSTVVTKSPVAATASVLPRLFRPLCLAPVSAPYQLPVARTQNTLSSSMRWTIFRPEFVGRSSCPNLLFLTMLFSGEASSRRSSYSWQHSPVPSSFSSSFSRSRFCPSQLLSVVASVRDNIHSAEVQSCRFKLILAVLLYPIRHSSCGCDAPVRI